MSVPVEAEELLELELLELELLELLELELLELVVAAPVEPVSPQAAIENVMIAAVNNAIVLFFILLSSFLFNRGLLPLA